MFDLIIVGGAGAGCSAGIYAARAGLKTVLITTEFGGQLLETESIENYPGIKKISGVEMSIALSDHLKEYPVEAIEGSKVKKIAKKGNYFIVETEEMLYEGKTVIIATGKRPRKLKARNSDLFEGKGMHHCAICDGPLYADQDVAVIGAGYAGIENALFLSAFCKKVFLLEFGGEISGEEITKQEVLKKENIEIITKAQVLEVYGKEMISGLKYKDLLSGKEKKLDVAAIFVNIGEDPNSEFVDCDKTEYGEIITDKDNMTSVKGLFAAGDVTNIRVKQLVVSAAEGCKAALAASKYLKFQKI
ncbi:MAG: pyridine nucleotide-disulfide oxidoreductase [Candidatus Diapherotrites archaeon CG08_land_8_20_14_0_20_34_12]|nr:MAG: pyridine nucleotide-disulfide oxidoreductase [Candidatus Diapherotrites archaeon CG08_land_8_20_14_0_20_34_12]